MDSQSAQVLRLIRASQAGSQPAFTALFEQYKNLVYRTALLMLDDGSRADPAAEAEEVLQEVFLRVHRSLATYQPDKAAFSTWLYRITVNHCLNLRRRRWLWLPLERLRGTANAAAPPPDEEITEAEAVRQALRRLSDKLRAAVVLRYYADLSHAEIAEVLGIPVGTVKSRLDLALKTLGRELRDQDLGASGQASEIEVLHCDRGDLRRSRA